MKIAFPVTKSPHGSGKYPVFYNGMEVGEATVPKDNDKVVLMSIRTTSKVPDEQKVLSKLVEKLSAKMASTSSVGDVTYDVINSNSMLEATKAGFAINDLPDYIPTEPIAKPTTGQPQ